MEKIQTSRKKTCDLILVFIVLILLLVGFFMVYSSSYPDGYYNYGDSIFFLKKQVMAGLAGILLMIITSYIPYVLYRKLSKIMLAVCVILSLLTVLLGVEGNGATRWLMIAGISIQPSEIIKIAAVLCMADFFDKRRNKLTKFVEGYIYSILAIVGFVALIIIQKDLSTSIVLTIVLLIMFFCAGAKFIHLFLTAILGCLAVIPLVAKHAYRIERIVVFLDPFKYITGKGWQLVQSLYALGTGGLFGLGLGKSRQKFFYLPEAYNDFIFSIIGEELGFIGCLGVIVLFILFAWRGLRIAMNAKDFYGSLVTIGITSLVLVQFLVHVAVATSSIPPTGRALPFISAGGTSVLFLLASMGIILNISKSADIYRN
ncbi:putative lipid II flippase FtsW [Sedimentibacter sp. zth1]|uniref:putative lipid II flippase FtsW n=1 Tax=Sedimentibacter sp. zth1 TaxID=2816908 RepID=UPI001A923733|nr:putative lipid II flippase FtsW [Sedimentibacter sp. zth1]QSX06150.1 putative lipid II flippase FtsW [Sedimentibacter sp. zth1]